MRWHTDSARPFASLGDHGIRNEVDERLLPIPRDLPVHHATQTQVLEIGQLVGHGLLVFIRDEVTTEFGRRVEVRHLRNVIPVAGV